MSDASNVQASIAINRAGSYLRFLRMFVAAQTIGRTDQTRERYDRVLDHLFAYLDEVDASRWLGTGPAEILSAERVKAGSGAFFRVFGLEELVCCVPGFLVDEWLMPTVTDAHTQVSLVGRLLQKVSAGRLIELTDLSCAWYEAEAAVREARRRLQPSARSAQTRPASLQLIQGGGAE